MDQSTFLVVAALVIVALLIWRLAQSVRRFFWALNRWVERQLRS